MALPKYTKNPVYQMLAEWANNAGIEIEYVKLERNIFGRYYKDKKLIQMSSINKYPDEDNAAFTLAHELAHGIIDDYFEYSDDCDKSNWMVYKYMDSDADKVGSALLSLAMMIYEQNSRKQFGIDN